MQSIQKIKLLLEQTIDKKPEKIFNKRVAKGGFVSSIRFLLWIFISLIIGKPGYGEDGRYAAVVVDDATGKILHAENAQAIRHPASLVKKMTLYLIFDALKKGKITLKTRYYTSSLAMNQEPCKLGLHAGHTIDVESIIKGLVTKSANDAAVVVAEGLGGSVDRFVRLMNQQAKKLGMKRTRFYNSSGLPDTRQVSTAMDMVILARALYHHFPEYYHYFKTKHFHYKGLSHRNHNHMLGGFPGLDGLKTGFTNASGFNISTSALRYDNKNRPHRLFAVVMGGTNRHARDKRAAELLEKGFLRVGACHLEPFNDTPGVPVRDSARPHLVRYTYQQQRSLDSVLEEPAPRSGVVQNISYGVNNIDLLERSLKISDQKRPLSPMPNIIQPLNRKTEKSELTPTFYKVSSSPRPYSAHDTCLSENGKRHVLPANWVVPKASVERVFSHQDIQKNSGVKVSLKKVSKSSKTKRSLKSRQAA